MTTLARAPQTHSKTHTSSPSASLTAARGAPPPRACACRPRSCAPARQAASRARCPWAGARPRRARSAPHPSSAPCACGVAGKLLGFRLRFRCVLGVIHVCFRCVVSEGVRSVPIYDVLLTWSWRAQVRTNSARRLGFADRVRLEQGTQPCLKQHASTPSSAPMGSGSERQPHPPLMSPSLRPKPRSHPDRAQITLTASPATRVGVHPAGLLPQPPSGPRAQWARNAPHPAAAKGFADYQPTAEQQGTGSVVHVLLLS